MAMAPLPPWARRIQQNATVAWAGPPIAIAVGFLGYKMFECSGQDITKFTAVCFWAAINSAIGYVVGYLGGRLWGHTPGSTSFDAAGNPIVAVAKLKEMADNVVAIQAQASDPT